MEKELVRGDEIIIVCRERERERERVCVCPIEKLMFSSMYGYFNSIQNAGHLCIPY